MTPTTSHENDPHRRAKRGLVRLYAGLLEESENEWLTGHLATCDACRAMSDVMEDERGGLLEDGRHLPSSLIARWGTEYPRLRGIQREFVEAHLQGCEECRRALHILGYAAEAARFAPAPAPIQRPPRRIAWLVATAQGRWITGGVLAAAASAIMLLVRIFGGVPGVMVADNNPKQPSVVTHAAQPESAAADTGPHPDRPERIPTPIPPKGLPAPAEVASLEVWTSDGSTVAEATPAIPLDHEVTRGSRTSDTTQVIRVKAGVHTLRLIHPEPALQVESDKATVDISVTTPSGKILHHRMTVGDLRQDRPLRLYLPGGVEAGTYRYSYVFGPMAHEAPIKGEVRIEVR